MWEPLSFKGDSVKYDPKKPIFEVGDSVNVIKAYTGVYVETIQNIDENRYRFVDVASSFHQIHLENLIPGSLIRIKKMRSEERLEAVVNHLQVEDYTISCVGVNQGQKYEANLGVTYPNGISAEWYCEEILRWGPATPSKKLRKIKNIII